VICGTCDIGQRNENQGLIWIGVLVIKVKELCNFLAESLAPTNSRRMIDIDPELNLGLLVFRSFEVTVCFLRDFLES
jgi:hypothetical protein